MVTEALQQGPTRAACDLGPIDAQSVGAYRGRSLDGYRRVLRSSDLRHVVKNHGGDAPQRADHLPITATDLLRIPDIVRYGAVQWQGEWKARKALRLRWTAQLGNFTYVYVEQVRAGRKQVAALTMYKKGGLDPR